jgi:hypothetical protein
MGLLRDKLGLNECLLGKHDWTEWMEDDAKKYIKHRTCFNCQKSETKSTLDFLDKIQDPNI